MFKKEKVKKVPAIEITKCGGLKCDNPNCDYEDMSIKVEDYKNWVDKPCPDCGCVLLTKPDYEFSKCMFSIIKFLNFILPKRKVTNTKNLATMTVKTNGDRRPDIKVEKFNKNNK